MEPRQPEDPAMAGPYRDPNVMDIDEWPYIMCPSIHEYINTRREVAKKKSEEKRVRWWDKWKKLKGIWQACSYRLAGVQQIWALW